MKIPKKLLSLLLVALSLSFTFSGFAISSSAHCIVTIPENTKTITKSTSAAPKLNKTKATLYKGGTLQLKVTGTKSKVRWSSSNKKVATVSSNGKVTAKKKGTATITAKVGKKKLKCSIKVNNKKTIKNVEYELQDTGRGVIAILKNNNKYAVSIEGKLVYLNNNGKMLDASSAYNYCLEPSATCALFFSGPTNSSYRYVEYSNFKLSMSVTKSYYDKYASSKISIKKNRGADNITIKATNKSKYDLDTIQIAIVFYDEAGNAIGYEYHYADCKEKKSSDYLSFNYPYDEDYETIRPASYKVYVNHAYRFW